MLSLELFMNAVIELPYPRWQSPLQKVILEFDPEKLTEKALHAEDVILERLRELRLSTNSHHEREALSYGLSVLKIIKRDRLGYPDW